MGTVRDEGQGVHGFGVDQDGDLHKVALDVAGDLVIEAGIAARHRLQAVVEVEHHLVQGQPVDGHGTAADVGQLHLLAAPLGTQLQDAAQVFVRHHDGGLDPRLFDSRHLHRIGHVDRVVQLLDRAVGEVNAVDDAGRRGDQLEVELALQALLHDLQVQKAQEAATVTEAERRRGLGLVVEAGVVEVQPLEGLAQVFVIG